MRLTKLQRGNEYWLQPEQPPPELLLKKYLARAGTGKVIEVIVWD